MATAPPQTGPRDVGSSAVNASDSAHPQIITVFGATGIQGGSVVRNLLDQGRFKVRAVTRNTSGAAAQRLANQPGGVDVVQADFNNTDLLRKAVAGSYAVFGTTNSWDPSSHGKEVEQGTALAKIAKEAGVQVFIWSSLPNVGAISGGKLDVSHFTDKALIWEEVKKLGFPSAVAIEPAFYWPNLENPNFVSESSDGSAVLNIPVLSEQDYVTGFDPDDTGAPITAILDSPQRYNAKRIIFKSVLHAPLSKLLEHLSQGLGVKATLNTIPYDGAAANMGKELAEMFKYFKEFSYYEPDPKDAVDVKEVTSAQLTTFDQWLRKSSLPGRFKK